MIRHNGKYADTDAAGNVVFRSEPTELDDAPEGWQEEAIQFMRNPFWWGVWRSMSNSFSFKKQGRKILLYLFYNFNIQAQAELIIHRRNPSTNWHEGYYLGDMDFSQFKHTEDSAELNIMEAGLIEMIQANKATTYEIPVDVPEAINVAMDGIVMYSNVVDLIPVDTTPNADNQPVPNVRYSGSVVLGTFLGEGETQYPSIVFNQFTTYLDGPNNPSAHTQWTDNWHFRATAAGRITGSFTLHVMFASKQYWVRLYKYNSYTGVVTRYTLANESYLTGIVRTLDIPIVIDQQFVDGDKFWLYWEMDVSGDGESVTLGDYDVQLVGSTLVYTFRNTPITFTYTYRHPETTVKMLRGLYVFDQLMRKISNNLFGATSVLLGAGGAAYDFVLTCGDAIRGLAGATIKTSLNDFFQSYNTRFNIGLGTNYQGGRIEVKEEFFQNAVLVNIGEVAKAEFTPYNEIIPNNVKIGWPNQENEVGDVNGKEEFNTTFEWTTPVTKHEKSLDLVASYRADCFGAEKIRTNLAGKDSVDDKGDNDTFIINIAPLATVANAVFDAGAKTITIYQRFQSVFVGDVINVAGSVNNNGNFTVTAVVKGATTVITVVETVNAETAFNVTFTGQRAALNRPAYDSVTGLTSADTAFNLELRPGLCIRAHGSFLRAGLHQMETMYLKYQTTDKNANLAVTSGGITITEKADILIATLAGKLCLPIMATVSVKVPINVVAILEANPYAQIQFQWKGVDYYGFLMKAGQQPAFNATQTYQLLLSTRVDPQKLISA